MSSIPIQFLIYVLYNLSCYDEPVILPLTMCLEVQVGQPVSFTLYGMNLCDHNRIILSDILLTRVINGLTASQLYNSSLSGSLSYRTISWTPQNNQIGYQNFCAIAYTR